ncbi:hypothetical protein HGB24_03615 [Candidatus Saccharibacteria bacterium]|nr:hypothetical protein [Candidatus Saccharibacteria bacterium]
MKITKAIIPVAGWGTRRLPVTKAIEKCMLPIGNRPVIDYVVTDCVKAGITDIYFVVGEQSTQIRDYYRDNSDLNDYLVRNHKESMLALIKPPKVGFHFITQPSYGKYGTAIPVSLVLPYIENDESVVVLMGDDCIYNQDDSSEVARLIESAGTDCAMLGVEVPPTELSRYGVIDMDDNGTFKRIVEKPSGDEAPSNLINVSKYVLNNAALRLINDYSSRDDISGEYYITDPINQYVQNGGSLRVVRANGQYLDSGTVEGWLKANKIVIEGQL